MASVGKTANHIQLPLQEGAAVAEVTSRPAGGEEQASLSSVVTL